MSRAAGILMHISSIPSPYGIGTFGKQAYEFTDFLKKAGQSYWQVLPFGPTSAGDSPYKTFSSFAGNPYFIDLDLLYNDGLLLKKELSYIKWYENENFVDYRKISESRLEILRTAYKRASKTKDEFLNFKQENQYWLKDYGLFMSIKNHFGNVSFLHWPDENIKFRKEKSMLYYQEFLKEDIDFWYYVQYLFFKQWKNLKQYVNKQGIKVIGDIPIYTSLDSSDVWSEPNVFLLDKKLKPLYVAGFPADQLFQTGQIWGNPLYNWEYLKNSNYKWWIKKIKFLSSLFDIIRIDHFRGFDNFFAIHYNEKTAEQGHWMKGPGIDFFKCVENQVGKLSIIAEDLGGESDPGVKKILKETGYPGMKVLQFAFDSDTKNPHLPHNYTKNSVVYTGTHDNNTIIGWLNSTSDIVANFAKEYCKLSVKEEYNWGLIRSAYASVSNLAIIPMQDFLGLNEKHRMNTPATIGDNWKWRLDKKLITEQLSLKIYNLTKLYGR